MAPEALEVEERSVARLRASLSLTGEQAGVRASSSASVS